MGTTAQNVSKLGYRFDFIGTLPKATAASEAMTARSHVRGRGASFRFSGGLIGKTLVLTDNKASTTTQKTITFTHAMFADPAQPTLAEIVTALNAVLSADGTPTVASSGADGRLVITGAAAGTDSELTIGAGSANTELGFPDCGVTTKCDNGVGIDFVLPAQFTGTGFGNEALYMIAPDVRVYTYTPSTGVHAQDVVALATAGAKATWTPSSRTLRIADITDAARAVHVVFEI